MPKGTPSLFDCEFNEWAQRVKRQKHRKVYLLMKEVNRYMSFDKAKKAQLRNPKLKLITK